MALKHSSPHYTGNASMSSFPAYILELIKWTNEEILTLFMGHNFQSH